MSPTPDAVPGARGTLRCRRGCDGTVLVTTLGTGIGSALRSAAACPHTELGHPQIERMSTPRPARELLREREELSYEDWAHGWTKYNRRWDLLWPDPHRDRRGVTSIRQFLPLIECRTPCASA